MRQRLPLTPKVPSLGGSEQFGEELALPCLLILTLDSFLIFFSLLIPDCTGPHRIELIYLFCQGQANETLLPSMPKTKTKTKLKHFWQSFTV